MSIPLAPKEVAARLGVSERTAARLMAEGEIASFRIGRKLLRCQPEEVDDYLSRPFERYRRERPQPAAAPRLLTLAS